MSKVIIVTGSNRGIGLELVRRLGIHYKDASLYLAARNEERGQAAVKKMREQSVCPIYHPLDVTDKSSISAFKETLIKKHGSSAIDILINNAGINLEGNKAASTVEKIEKTIKVNYFGVLDVCQALLPLLRPNARVLTLASTLSLPVRKQLHEDLREKMDGNDLTADELNTIMTNYVMYAKERTHIKMGYCNQAYHFSKYSVISLMRIFARDNQVPGVLMNSCCPGWVRTDMGTQRAPISVEDGVETPLYCVLLPEGRKKPNGQFIFNKAVVVMK